MKDHAQKQRQQRIKDYQTDCIVDQIIEKNEIPENLLKAIYG